MNTIFDVIVEPSHVPGPQVIRAHDPPDSVAPIQEREIALEPAVMTEHRRQLDAARTRQLDSHHPVEPLTGPRPRNLVPREAGDVQDSNPGANLTALLADNVESVGSPKGRNFLEAAGCVVDRDLQPVGFAPVSPVGGHGVVGGGHAHRSSRPELLVGIGDDKPARVELAGHLLDVLPVLRIGAESGDIHREYVFFGLSFDHPLGKGFANAATLQEARHDRARRPVIPHTGHRAHERISVG